jgi:hypothetical protein
MPVATTNQQPAQVMQGITVPATSVNAPAFYQNTRRQTLPFATNKTFSGLGSTDIVTALQTGIISRMAIRVTGTVTVTLGGGTAATTNNWPYGLFKAVRFTANGQSNLINASGPWLKSREATRDVVDDRGVFRQARIAQPAANTLGNLRQGSLSLSSEEWGATSAGVELGPEVTAIVAGTYVFDITVPVPVAFDEVTLVGAIFAQTQATELALNIDWAATTDLFALTGAATAVVAASYTVEGTVYDIPQVGGQIIVPNLSLFHQLIQTRNTAVSTGDNEYTLPGQGVGKQLMRIGFRTWSGAGTASAPLPLSTPSQINKALAPNYGQIGWRYGGNMTPDLWTSGRELAIENERLFNGDFSQLFGMGWIDFAAQSALRDSVNEATATQLRLLYNLSTALTLVSPFTEVVQETLFGAAAGG